MELSNRVRAARAYAGLTQDELATRLGFSLATMQRMEMGTRAFKQHEERSLTEAIGDACGLPPAFFTVDFATLGAPGDGSDDESLARLERQLQRLSTDLRDHGKASTQGLEKLARGVAHDRGKLGRIEKDLAQLAHLLLDHVKAEEE